MICRGLGVQLTTQYRSGRQTSHFIEQSAIASVFIHEAMELHRVVFYLALEVQQESDLVVVFPSMRPQLAILQSVYRNLRTFSVGPQQSHTQPD